MPEKPLKKSLGLLGVYAIATGATLSAGFFLLPGLAAEKAGPALVLAYLLAAVPLIPAMLSKIELMTAMPRAGGIYYFLDRSLGPLLGTIGGIGVWLVLILKVAFALVGMGAYIALFFPELPIVPVAVALAVVIGALNAYGAKLTGLFQTLLLVGLLAVLGLFIGVGVPAIEPSRFAGFFDAGAQSIFATAGLVYVSYAGLTKVAGVAEEVEDPEHNITRGILLALATALVVYGVGTAVIVGVVPMPRLEGDLTSVATAGEIIFGPWGKWLLAGGALLAFTAVTNAGVLSTSRYPMAMSRDEVMPAFLKRLNAQGIPVASVALTVGVLVAVIVFLHPMKIAKLASVFQLLVFAMVCLAVIVMRESGIDSYDPGFRSPFYPWTQLAGIAAPLALIAVMGWESILFSVGLIAACAGWYFFYAQGNTPRAGAVYHLFERLGRQRHHSVNRELRQILKEKGLRSEDPFDEVVAGATVLEIDENPSFETVVRQASGRLAETLGATPEELAEMFSKETKLGMVPVSHGAALLHLRTHDVDTFHMLLVRVTGGVEADVGHIHLIHASEGAGAKEMLDDAEESANQDNGRSVRTKGPSTPPLHAFFFLISPEHNPQQHLRLMARLAGCIEDDDFLDEWLDAPGEQGLKETLLRDERFLSLRLRNEGPTASLIGHAIRDVDLPGSLIALIYRNGRTLVPHGDDVLERGDQLTVIGDREGIAELRERYANSQNHQE